jgi:hypothetical protein
MGSEFAGIFGDQLEAGQRPLLGGHLTVDVLRTVANVGLEHLQGGFGVVGEHDDQGKANTR